MSDEGESETFARIETEDAAVIVRDDDAATITVTEAAEGLHERAVERTIEDDVKGSN